MHFLILVVMGFAGGIVGGLLYKHLFGRNQKTDGEFVITQTDGKTIASLEFDDFDQVVRLRNKQRVVLRVVGPEDMSS